jgi:hypothetical protein
MVDRHLGTTPLLGLGMIKLNRDPPQVKRTSECTHRWPDYHPIEAFPGHCKARGKAPGAINIKGARQGRGDILDWYSICL